MSLKESIAEIEKRFQIVLTMSIFFPVLMTTYFDIVGGPDKDKHTAFTFFALPALYISSYVLFQIYKTLRPIPKLALSILNWGILFGIACFALPILYPVMAYFGTSLPKLAYWVDTWTYIGSMLGMIGLAFVILLFVSASIAITIVAASMGKRWANKKIF
jgi:hypothetical protein